MDSEGESNFFPLGYPDKSISDQKIGKLQDMTRRKILLLITIAFLNFSLLPAHAQEAIVLTDSELDEVHAGGLPESSLPAMILDAVIAGDSKIGYSYTTSGSFDPAYTDVLKALAAGQGSVNSVQVEDAAQQGLHSLINVNAAGSVVPIQLNLTIITNSTVGNITNSNSLNLNNYIISNQ